MKSELEPRAVQKNAENERSNANDPFVLKKVAESKAFLEKHGFPEELVKWRKSQELKLQKPSE